MKRMLAAAAAALLLAIPTAGFAAHPPEMPAPLLEAQGPDFSACDAEEGRDYGQCVAAIARAYGDEHAGGADASNAPNVVEQEDEHASAVAAAAQELVDDCDAKEGREFGKCVSAAAKQLGELAGGEETQGRSDPPRIDSTPAAGRGRSGQ